MTGGWTPWDTKFCLRTRGGCCSGIQRAPGKMALCVPRRSVVIRPWPQPSSWPCITSLYPPPFSPCTSTRLVFLDVPQGRLRRRRRRILFVNRYRALIPFSVVDERFSSACCHQTVRSWRHSRFSFLGSACTYARFVTKLSANYPSSVWQPFAGTPPGSHLRPASSSRPSACGVSCASRHRFHT